MHYACCIQTAGVLRKCLCVRVLTAALDLVNQFLQFIDADLFLLDEPFSALDDSLREELTELLLTYLRKNHICTILVTHQKSDAEKMADRILELA